MTNKFSDSSSASATADKSSTDIAPLIKASESLKKVVGNMIKAGIPVPSVYQNFLEDIEPPIVDQTIKIETKPPLFSILGVDESGSVKIKTSKPLVIKSGDTNIKLSATKLIDTLNNSKKLDLSEFRDECIKKEKSKSWDTHDIITVDKSLSKSNIFKNECKENVDVPNAVSSNSNNQTTGEKEMKDFCDRNDTVVRVDVPKSVNLNAYEIRLKILQEALNWVRNDSVKGEKTISDVIDVANKLYSFVEKTNRY